MEEQKFHPGMIAKHSAAQSSLSEILTDFDDTNKIVVVSDVFSESFDVFSFLELGGDTFIKVQEYTRTFCDGLISVEESNNAPFAISCRDYFHYYQLCNRLFAGEAMNSEKENAKFKAVDECGNSISFDLEITVLYAIDIPLKTFTIELDTLFRHNFKLGDLILPGKKLCYFQFVS